MAKNAISHSEFSMGCKMARIRQCVVARDTCTTRLSGSQVAFVCVCVYVFGSLRISSAMISDVCFIDCTSMAKSVCDKGFNRRIAATATEMTTQIYSEWANDETDDERVCERERERCLCVLKALIKCDTVYSNERTTIQTDL